MIAAKLELDNWIIVGWFQLISMWLILLLFPNWISIYKGSSEISIKLEGSDIFEVPNLFSA